MSVIKTEEKKNLQAAYMKALEAGVRDMDIIAWAARLYPDANLRADILSRFKHRVVLGDAKCAVLAEYLKEHGFLSEGAVKIPSALAASQSVGDYFLPSYEEAVNLMGMAALSRDAAMIKEATEMVQEWGDLSRRIGRFRAGFDTLRAIMGERRGN